VSFQTNSTALGMLLVLSAAAGAIYAQQSPYDVFPSAEPPYFRVRYEASSQPAELRKYCRPRVTAQ
jgi:hypothetical protein